MTRRGRQTPQMPLLEDGDAIGRQIQTMISDFKKRLAELEPADDAQHLLRSSRQFCEQRSYNGTGTSTSSPEGDGRDELGRSFREVTMKIAENMRRTAAPVDSDHPLAASSAFSGMSASMYFERPPTRQKPPPEALDLEEDIKTIELDDTLGLYAHDLSTDSDSSRETEERQSWTSSAISRPMAFLSNERKSLENLAPTPLPPVQVHRRGIATAEGKHRTMGRPFNSPLATTKGHALARKPSSNGLRDGQPRFSHMQQQRQAAPRIKGTVVPKQRPQQNSARAPRKTVHERKTPTLAPPAIIQPEIESGENSIERNVTVDAQVNTDESSVQPQAQTDAGSTAVKHTDENYSPVSQNTPDVEIIETLSLLSAREGTNETESQAPTTQNLSPRESESTEQQQTLLPSTVSDEHRQQHEMLRESIRSRASEIRRRLEGSHVVWT